jgi:hypothetical protein
LVIILGTNKSHAKRRQKKRLVAALEFSIFTVPAVDLYDRTLPVGDCENVGVRVYAQSFTSRRPGEGRDPATCSMAKVSRPDGPEK